MAEQEEETKNKVSASKKFTVSNRGAVFAVFQSEKGFKLLGILDVQNTLCARDAILHGAGGSVTAGLLHFLVTSRVRRSCHVGFAGFMLTTLGSWFYCRLNNAKLRVQQRMIQDGIKNKIVYEGTVLDPTQKHGVQTPSGPS
ncbi:Cytochrome c oxidase protein 20-like protein [Nibea albiflora]|uniref:Cytochrome c oxidase protein 20-like protein n=1 Tax=Nibea albiflora TaxID=240163 RepID=A0ACB7EHJ7_NIBAL|nr:Cytochrome c oxidase protein 20-like protein [Nibea albiflora]